MSDLDLAARLELAAEIEARIEQRYTKERSKLEAVNAAALHKLEVSEARFAVLAADLQAALNREKENADFIRSGKEAEKKAARLKEKLNLCYAQSKELKEENEAFRRLNPAENKKKLEDLRRQHKETKGVVSALTNDKRHLIEIVAGQKLELEKVSTRNETSSDNYLYASRCKRYRVIGTSFASLSRPFVKESFNYRIIDMETGASYVALLTNGIVTFDELPEGDVPQDVITFIGSSITFDSAPPL